jgi:WD40 repeat protein
MQFIGFHGGEVCTVSSSPNGELVASACPEKIRVWNASSKTLFVELEGNTAVAFAPCHDRLAFGGPENTTVLFDTRSWKRLMTYGGHNAPVSAVAFSRDGHLASASQIGTIIIWDSTNGKLLRRLEAADDDIYITALAFWPSTSGLASLGTMQIWDTQSCPVLQDGPIQIWDTRSCHLLKQLPGNGTSDTALAFSPDGKVLASRGPGETIQIWDTEWWQLLKQLPCHTGCVIALAFSPHGKVLASASYDGSIKIWDTESWQCFATNLCVGDVGFIRALAFLDDRTVVAGSSGSGRGGSVALWSYPALNSAISG